MSDGFRVVGEPIAFCAGVALLVASMLPSASAWTLSDGADVHPAYRGVVPEKSSVIFSTRSKRPDSIDMARRFGATRVEWVYTSDRAFVQQLKDAVPWFGGTINANGPLPSDDGYAQDFDGAPLTPPWMKAWGAKWVTTTHPHSQKVIADQISRFIAMGANSIQVDDPNFQYHGALFHGGDFNPSTLAGFPEFLASYPDRGQLKILGLDGFDGNYKDYLKFRYSVKDAADYKRRFRTLPSTPVWLAYIKSTVAANYTRIRKLISVAAPNRKVALSTNLASLVTLNAADPMFHLAAFTDYAMPETRINDIIAVYSMAGSLRALQTGWVPSILLRSLADNRYAIAMMYALGGQPLIPWDVYDGNDENGMPRRYYGRTDDYLDLYSFVQSRRLLFDGYESAAIVGVVVLPEKYHDTKTKALLSALVEKNISFAFVPIQSGPGAMELDVGALKKFKVIVMLNPDTDFDQGTLSSIVKSGVERFPVEGLTSSTIDSWRPFVLSPGGEQVRIIPRAVPGEQGHIVMHVIDQAQALPGASGLECQRRIGIRSLAFHPDHVVGAHWNHGPTRVQLTPARTEGAVYFSLPECVLWGILELELSH